MDFAATRAINIEFGPEFDKKGMYIIIYRKNACNIVLYIFSFPRAFIFIKFHRILIKL